MLTIKNYRDIPENQRDAVIQKIFEIGIGPATGKHTIVKREFEHSQEGSLPQYFFLFRDFSLVGFVFLITEQNEPVNKLFPWWSIHSLDTLPHEETAPVFEYIIGLCEEYGCLKLKDRFENDPSYHKI